MINEKLDKQAFWIRITKSASTSINLAFTFGNDVPEELLEAMNLDDSYSEGKYLNKVFYPSTIEQILANHKKSNCFIFINVRNPYSRFIAGWKYLEKTRYRKPTDVIKQFKGLKQDYDISHISKRQVDYITSPKGKIIKPNMILHTETIQEDFTKLCKKLGIKEEISLKQVRVSKHRPYKEYYEQYPELQELVYSYFKEDFDYFGYSKELLSA